MYIVKNKKHGYDNGAFYVFDTAFEHAKKEALEEQEEMCIDKIQIVKDSEIPKCKSYGRWNPILFPDKAEMEEYYDEYSDGEVGGVTISKDGNISYWWSAETTPEERAAMALAILKVEPGGYIPCVDLLRNGLSGLLPRFVKSCE